MATIKYHKEKPKLVHYIYIYKNGVSPLMSSPNYQENLNNIRQICREFTTQETRSLSCRELLQEFRLFLRQKFNTSVDTYQLNLGNTKLEHTHDLHILSTSVACLFEEHFRTGNMMTINQTLIADAEAIIREELSISEEDNDKNITYANDIR